MSDRTELAVHGGSPVRDAYLPYGRQWIEEDDIQAVAEILRSDYLTTGPAVDEFEESFARSVDACFAVAFSSGTAALHAACFAAGIGPGSEVITTPMTFAASANCILYQGGKPVFADIDPVTCQIEPNCILPLINDRTKAIIPVDYTGQPVNHEEIQHMARQFGLIVIEDAAHALGAAYKGRKIGSISDMTMFSLHPVKHVTTGEGGIVTTDKPEYAEKLRQFRNHGITRDRSRLGKDDGPWYYEMQMLGYNYRMTDIQAALGLSQLKKLNGFLERRKAIVRRYNRAFSDMDAIRIPAPTPVPAATNQSAWHLYVIRLRLEVLTAGRKEIFLALQKENIGVQVHYIPVHTLPFYRQLGYKPGLCPNAESLYEQIISLPLFPKMSDRDVDDVIGAVRKVTAYYTKTRGEQEGDDA